MKNCLNVCETLSYAIFIADSRGVIIDINKQFARLLGFDKKQLIGKSYHNYIFPIENDYEILLQQKEMNFQVVHFKNAREEMFEASFHLSMVKHMDTILIGVLKQREISSTKKQVLILTNEKKLSEIIEKNLAPFYRVKSEDFSDEVLSFIGKDNTTDAIFCDLTMSLKTATKFFNLFERKDKELEKRVIFIASRKDLMDTKSFLCRNNHLCLLRPFSKEDLFRALRILQF